MKKIAVALFAFMGFSALGQPLKSAWGLGYAFSAPRGAMQHNISSAHGFTLDYYLVPDGKRLGIGIELAINIYGHDKTSQEYTFSDGTVAPMDIIVNNFYTNLQLGGRYWLTEGKILKPYLAAKAGYAWYRTNLNIYDPDDFDHCKPIDTDMLQKDGTFIITAGTGILWDLSSVFNGKDTDQLFFNLGATITTGGMVNYMNTDTPSHSASQTADLQARFLNTQTMLVHKHHVGYVYSSMVDMIELRGGIIWRPQMRQWIF